MGSKIKRTVKAELAKVKAVKEEHDEPAAKRLKSLKKEPKTVDPPEDEPSASSGKRLTDEERLKAMIPTSGPLGKKRAVQLLTSVKNWQEQGMINH